MRAWGTRCVATLGVVVLLSRVSLAQAPPPDDAIGEPYSIQLVASDGQNTIADPWHARFSYPATLKLTAIVRDQAGHIIPNAEEVCDPKYDVEDNRGIPTLAEPNGALRGWPETIGNDTWLHFGQSPGVFSVNVHCDKFPSVTSKSHQAPLNFETIGPGLAPFSPHAPNTPNTPTTPIDTSGGHRGPNVALIVLGAVLLALAVVALTAAAESSSTSSSSSYCFSIASSNTGSCEPGNYCDVTQAACEADYQQVMAICTCHVVSCTVTYGPNPCAATRTAPRIRDVHQLVAEGLARRTSIDNSPVRRVVGAVVPTTTTTTHSAAIAAPVANASSRGVWVGATLTGVALASMSYGIWARVRSKPSRIIRPWVQADGGGLLLDGRF